MYEPAEKEEDFRKVNNERSIEIQQDTKILKKQQQQLLDDANRIFEDRKRKRRKKGVLGNKRPHKEIEDSDDMYQQLEILEQDDYIAQGHFKQQNDTEDSRGISDSENEENYTPDPTLRTIKRARRKFEDIQKHVELLDPEDRKIFNQMMEEKVSKDEHLKHLKQNGYGLCFDGGKKRQR